MRSVLLIKCGDAAPEIRLTAGDYDAWFARSMAGLGVDFTRVRPYLGEALPDPRGFDAVVVSGSGASVRDRAPWMLSAAEWLRGAVDRGVPMLAVCFGHQLLGLAFGANVILNPNGRETGSVELRLTGAGLTDPLFRDLPEVITVQATHEDIVDRLPDGATLLAGNANTPVQAFALGRTVRAVQFHPELPPDGMRAVIEARADRLEREAVERGRPPGERVPSLLAGLRPSPAGPKLLANFLEAFT